MKKTGLNQEEVLQRLQEFGPNEIQDVAKTSVLQILSRQIKKNIVIYLLTLTAIASFFLGENITGYVIIIVALIVVVTGFIQEFKAEKAIDALKVMIRPVSRVIREGKEQEIPSRDIVPGDVIFLRTGEKIPADCAVIEENNLKVNESVLTGESSDIKKTAALQTDRHNEENLLFMGSFVVDGKCLAIVLQTGMSTKFGKIAGMISTAEKHLPLQDKVNKLSFYMIIVGVAAALITGLVLFMRAETLHHEVIINILIITIAIAVSSFPEGFPVVLTTTLATGVNRMAKQNAVVNRMSIIETLGETTVICSDKTGTLTKGEMTVRKVYADRKIFEVSGVGYETRGAVSAQGAAAESPNNSVMMYLAQAAIICNDSNIERSDSGVSYNILGSSTEGSLLVFGAKLGMYKESFPNTRQGEIPFDSLRKMMSVLYPHEKEKYVYAKGAPEEILQKCSYILTESGVKPLTKEDIQEIFAKNHQFTQAAYRSLAFAYKVSQDSAYKEDELVFLGLVGMEDPPREEVKEAINLCLESGIKVKMVTGDHKDTAQAIAKQIGIVGDVLTGQELDALSDEQLNQVVDATAIFARVKPEHKLRIVQALKGNKQVVTMTGDGVNDAPALKESHIGVAMGINGTDVSRAVADITLKDDNFVTIVAAIKEGRTIFNNIRKFVTYQLSCNLSDICIIFSGMIVAPFLGWYTPVITALQILFMNIITDNIPAITLGFTPTSKDIMKEKPRIKAQILTNEFMALIILNGVLMGAISFIAAYISYNILELPKEVARTTVLVSMILMQIANAYNFRSFRYRVLNRGIFINRYLVLASLVSLVAMYLIIYTPLRNIFETTALNWESWIIASGSALAVVLFFDIYKTINNKTHLFLSHTT